MAKPSSLPRWVTDGNAALSAVVVDPTSGKKDIGWTTEEKPPAQIHNWFWNLTYKWLVWVDGFLAENHTWTGAHVFSSTVNFDGAVDMDADLDAQTASFHGAVDMDSTLAVTGGVTGTDFVATGEGGVRHVAVSHTVTPSTWGMISGTVPDWQLTGSKYSLVPNGASATFTIPLSEIMRQGDRLKSVTALTNEDNTETISMQVYSLDGVGVRSPLGSLQTSGASTGDGLLTVTGLTETLGAAESIIAEFTMTGNGVHLYSVGITFDRVV